MIFTQKLSNICSCICAIRLGLVIFPTFLLKFNFPEMHHNGCHLRYFKCHRDSILNLVILLYGRGKFRSFRSKIYTNLENIILFFFSKSKYVKSFVCKGHVFLVIYRFYSNLKEKYTLNLELSNDENPSLGSHITMVINDRFYKLVRIGY